MAVSKPVVLFLCTGNSCRSQMAEGFLRAKARDKFDAHSAGLQPKEKVHPLAVRVMSEIGIDISEHRPKDVRDYLGKIPVRHVIVVCGQAEQSCPRIFPFALERLYWPFDDPAQFVGPPPATLEKFREVRDQIGERIESWLQVVGDEA